MKISLAVLATLFTISARAGATDPGLQAFNKEDYNGAHKIWTQQAHAGDAGAQYRLGWMYRTGTGTDSDLKAAEDWLQLAASQGHALARLELARLRRTGPAVTHAVR